MKIKRVLKALGIRFRRYVLRDQFLLAGAKWFSDNGDSTLRLDYPLKKDSLVFDIGSYIGDFADEINKKYGCTVYLFEPVHSSYQKCVTRFKGNSQIKCFNFGLSSRNGHFEIKVAENDSSFQSPNVKGDTELVEVRSIVDFLKDMKISQIDLMKINIEGDEYNVLPELIDSEYIKIINNLQIQFHNFVDDAYAKRNSLRSLLGKTHKEMWCYHFIWESWKLKND